MTEHSNPLLTNYDATIIACVSKHTLWVEHKRLLDQTEQDLHQRLITDMTVQPGNTSAEPPIGAGYVAGGSNDQARKDRRERWISENYPDLVEAIADLKHKAALAEIEYEAAKHRVSFWRLACELEVVMGQRQELSHAETR